MLRSILIHNDNTPLKKLVDETFYFSLDQNEIADNDIDTYISTYVISELASYEFDVIYIKDSLGSNYVDFYGLLVAHHIRLSEELGDKRYVPIVILSDLEAYSNKK